MYALLTGIAGEPYGQWDAGHFVDAKRSILLGTRMFESHVHLYFWAAMCTRIVFSRSSCFASFLSYNSACRTANIRVD
jgi:hypothetical protein